MRLCALSIVLLFYSLLPPKIGRFRMTSTSAGRIRNATHALNNDNQSLIADIRKGFTMMKELAVDFERDQQSHLVKELENGLAELIETYEDCQHHTTALESVSNSYQPQPGPELTDFKRLLENEFAKCKASSSSDFQNHQIMRQFRELVWNVHHQGEPMPGDEQEDIVMTSTQCGLLNVTCPLTGKPVIVLSEPVRSMDCKHVYEKIAIMQHIKNKHLKCPVAGCPKKLELRRIVCDPLLHVEIDELRSMSKQTAQPTEIEDFTALSDED
ncbi:E3 SUMO-protein ligase MMS21 [Rutidosis leptorrhynchoides]|uniref:E3 SUMO-protein ligase MMS21 n=1 Tax=Rutidosis leptorrhynchoides TaxID=125765 RepID=UPI003A9A1EEE